MFSSCVKSESILLHPPPSLLEKTFQNWHNFRNKFYSKHYCSFLEKAWKKQSHFYYHNVVKKCESVLLHPRSLLEKSFQNWANCRILFQKLLLFSRDREGSGVQSKTITFLVHKRRQKMWVYFATPPKPSREKLSKLTQF